MKTVSKTSDSAGDAIKSLVAGTPSQYMTDDAVLLHSGRNKIWRRNVGGQEIAVKMYGNSFIKSIIYIARKTKARRAFENAAELVARGIHTPRPLAFSETRDCFNRLTGSQYISEYEKSAPLEKYLGDGDVMDEFARFAATLHDKGILHHDFNSTNIRVINCNGRPTFSLIDINRMKFLPEGTVPSLHDRFENLTRFSGLDQGFMQFIKSYIGYSRLPADSIDMALLIKKAHDRKWDKQHRRKDFFKKIFRTKDNPTVRQNRHQ